MSRAASRTRGAPRRSRGSWWAWRSRRRLGSWRGRCRRRQPRRSGHGRDSWSLAALAVVLALARPRRGRAGTRAVAGARAGGCGPLRDSRSAARGSPRSTPARSCAEAGDRRSSSAAPSRLRRAPRASATRFALDAARGPHRGGTAAGPYSPRGGIPANSAEFLLSARLTRAPRSSSAAPCVSRRPGSARRSSARVPRAFSRPTRIETTGAARGGLRGALDDVRRRAEPALERGTAAGRSRASPRLRPRPGRPHPGGRPRRLPPLGSRARSRGLGAERDAPGDPRDAPSRTGRRAASHPARRDRAHHRDLRPGRRRGRVDPAGGRDGHRRRRRITREQAGGAVVRAGRGCCRDPGDRSPRNRATSAGSSPSAPSPGSWSSLRRSSASSLRTGPASGARSPRARP